LIENSPDYAGQNIRLISCNTGKEGAGFAKNLSNKMGVDVLAPDDYMWPWPGGTYTIGPGVWINDVLLPVFPHNGQMVPFTPGKP